MEDLKLSELDKVETITLKSHGYKYYRKNYNNTVSDRQLYLDIVHSYLSFMKDSILDGNEILLGAGLGPVAIVGKRKIPKVNKNGRILAPVDWGETNKLWARDEEARAKKTRVFHFNEHSDFIKYNYVWSKGKDKPIKNISYYSLTFMWHNRRGVAEKVKAQNKEYQISIT